MSPVPLTTIGVVVPVADEEVLLPGCLTALRRARDAAATIAGLFVRIVAVLDACTDGSAEVVAAAGDVEAVHVAQRSVGHARTAGCRFVLADEPDPATVWLATTDADSRVPADWLCRMADYARAGADLVLGTVEPDDDGPRDAVLAAEWARRYTGRDGHRHVHGANLGIRGDVYLAVQGWAPVAFDEDVDLVRRVEAAGARRIIRSGAMPVRTSVRRTGRTPAGFAGWLRALDDLDPAG